MFSGCKACQGPKPRSPDNIGFDSRISHGELITSSDHLGGDSSPVNRKGLQEPLLKLGAGPPDNAERRKSSPPRGRTGPRSCMANLRSTTPGGEEVFDIDAIQYPPAPDPEAHSQENAEPDDSDQTLVQEDARSVVERLNGQLVEVKQTMRMLRIVTGVLLTVVAFLACGVGHEELERLPAERQTVVKDWMILCSIPVVALLFTWFHIWLAIQMMFRPIRFLGLWQYKDTGMGIGWQGVVPRKANKMAKTAYAKARPHIDGPRAWMGRVEAPLLIDQVQDYVLEVVEGSLETIGKIYFPKVLSATMRKRTAEMALAEIRATSPKVWKDFTEILCDDDEGIDNDKFFVKVFAENKELLNNFFLTLGDREFRFIEKCGAAMGFFCGLVQLIAFKSLGPVGRAIFLPTTGFFLGIVTNWLAIAMVFKPAYPRHIKIFGVHVYTVQGLFLKRQADVSVLYAKMVRENFLNFTVVIDYVGTLPIWEKLKAAYTEQNTAVLRQTMGSVKTWLAEMVLGEAKYAEMENALKVELARRLNEAEKLHQVAGAYIGKVTHIESNTCKALKRMRPDQFEDLLHPVFQEDEWILILLGGVLGVMVGLGQVYFLSG